jgi:hypothetical protein
MSSSSSSSCRNAISLLDDDDDLDLGHLSVAAPLASSSSLATAACDDDLFNITADSSHAFPDYSAMRGFLDEYEAKPGFEVRYPGNSGKAARPTTAGPLYAGATRSRQWC